MHTNHSSDVRQSIQYTRPSNHATNPSKQQCSDVRIAAAQTEYVNSQTTTGQTFNIMRLVEDDDGVLERHSHHRSNFGVHQVVVGHEDDLSLLDPVPGNMTMPTQREEGEAR